MSVLQKSGHESATLRHRLLTRVIFSQLMSLRNLRIDVGMQRTKMSARISGGMREIGASSFCRARRCSACSTLFCGLDDIDVVFGTNLKMFMVEAES